MTHGDDAVTIPGATWHAHRPSGSVYAIETGAEPWPVGRTVLAAFVLTICADFLFWDRPVGVSLALFALITGIAAVFVAPSAFAGRRAIWLFGLLGLSVLPVIEYVQVLSVLFLLAGIAIFVLLATRRTEVDAARLLEDGLTLPIAGAYWFLTDLFGLPDRVGVRGRPNSSVLVAWGIPLTLGAIYLALFSNANPVIENWMDRILSVDITDLLDPARLLLWTLCILAVWPLLRVLHRALPLARPWEEPGYDTVAPSHPLLSQSLLVNTLVILNGLFAVQTGLDALYLWGGASLPDGMTYAEYAHRGAYSLFGTAVLSAVIAVAATTFWRPTGAIRWLIALWILQNILLLVSSVLRLDLYVEAYALTYLRVGAFIWMGIVAVGFVLILVRMVLNRNNRWLVNANAAVVTVVLYGCCFINFADMIAWHNVTQSRDYKPNGSILDVAYLCRMGPHARPALAFHKSKIAAGPCEGDTTLITDDGLPAYDPPESWEGWSFRNWRLEQQLARE